MDSPFGRAQLARLGLTSVLVQTAPARTAVAAPSKSTDQGVYSATLDSNLYQLQFEIVPAGVGDNELHLYAFTPQGAPLTVQEWKVSAALPAQGIEPVDVPVLPVTESHDHATGTVTLPSAGAWRFSFTLRISDFDEATVTATVPVK
jgi:copper transport protein